MGSHCQKSISLKSDHGLCLLPIDAIGISPLHVTIETSECCNSISLSFLHKTPIYTVTERNCNTDPGGRKQIVTREMLPGRDSMGLSKHPAPCKFLLSITVEVKSLSMLASDTALQWDFSLRSWHFMKDRVMLTVDIAEHPLFQRHCKNEE